MRAFLHLALGLPSLALLCGTIIPLIHANAWWVRIFDFPRVQLAVAMAIVLVGYAGLRCWTPFRWWEYAPPALLAAGLVWQVAAILPYTMLYPRQVADSREDDASSRISLLISNVLYDNRDVPALLELIRETNPDVILLTEPTTWWQEQLADLEHEYPHTILQGQDNEYGMLLYSRLELIDPEVRFLVESEVPSIRTRLRLRSGEVVGLYGLHPRPPGLLRPEKDEREDSDVRDAELLLVAKEVAQLDGLPVIVAGDFNDVAWSRSTHLFQRIGGMLDPRVGRGLYNTYNANRLLLRYPLDHVFVSDHFRLVELRRLRHIGSDHFPMLAVLDYDPTAAAEQDEPQADGDDHEEADEAIEEVR